jgi:DUF2075 family protein
MMIDIGAWQMAGNANPDADRLAPGIPPSNFWASDPNGIGQVGRVYTAQGFEFDYVGAIWGPRPALGRFEDGSSRGVVRRSSNSSDTEAIA